MHEVELMWLDTGIPEALRSMAYATDGSIAVDIRAPYSFELWPGEQKLINCGFAIHIKSPGVGAFIYPRSGMGGNGLVLANTVGVIDSDYQGEIKINALNRIVCDTPSLRDKGVIRVYAGERFAQMVFAPIVRVGFQVVDEFSSETGRGVGGFGSTGK